MSRRSWLRPAVGIGAAALAIAVARSTRQGGARPVHSARYVQVGSLSLRYLRSGAGPTLVLLHGYGESLLTWRAVLDALSRDHDVVAVDLPGFGLSTKPPGGYATDSVATIVAAAMATLDVRDAVLVGHSLGGAVAAAVAGAQPEAVRGLVLLAPAMFSAPDLLPDTARATALNALRAAVGRYEALRTHFTPPHDPHWLDESDSALAYLPADDPAYLRSLEAVLREFDFASLTPERAARLTMPILLVWGRFDPVIAPGDGDSLATRLPAARLAVIDRAWHRPHLERPEETVAVIRDFLAGLAARTTVPTGRERGRRIS